MSIARSESIDTSHEGDELLSLDDVAGMIRVPVATLRYWRHLGTGPHSFRIGRSVRYWRSEVIDWLDHESADRQSSRGLNGSA